MGVPSQLKTRIERITNLPTLPRVATHLMKAVNSEHSSAPEVASLVGQDMSLSARVLRLANSAFFGMPRTITNLSEAVVIMGFKAINTMVLSLTVFDMFPGQDSGSPFDRRAFWRHCLTCGVVAQLITRRATLKGVDPEDAFCAGLLHDIGKIAMEQYLHEDLCRALVHSRETGKPSNLAETTVLGYTHADVAGWLISHWDLPDVLAEPIVYHHGPLARGNCADNVSVCHMADWLSHWLPDDASEKNGGKPALIGESHSLAGITPDLLEEVGPQVSAEMQKMSLFLDVLGG